MSSAELLSPLNLYWKGYTAHGNPVEDLGWDTDLICHQFSTASSVSPKGISPNEKEDLLYLMLMTIWCFRNLS